MLRGCFSSNGRSCAMRQRACGERESRRIAPSKRTLGARVGIGDRERQMPLAKLLIARWFPVCAGGLVACSGTAGSGLMSPPASVDAASDASVASVHTAADGSPETQASSSATPGILSGGQGDSALIGAGDASAGDTRVALDGGTDAGPSPDAPIDGSAGDAGTCVVTFTVTGALVDGFVFQNVVLGGDAAALGGWDSTQALKMTM